MSKREEGDRLAVICFTASVVMLAFFSVYHIGYSRGQVKSIKIVRVESSLHTGIPSGDGPVMLWFFNNDGTIRGESAIATDYAGVLPFSVTARAVPMQRYDGWLFWSELDSRLVEANK
jgi:hypothetical protein